MNLVRRCHFVLLALSTHTTSVSTPFCRLLCASPCLPGPTVRPWTRLGTRVSRDAGVDTLVAPRVRTFPRKDTLVFPFLFHGGGGYPCPLCAGSPRALVTTRPSKQPEKRARASVVRLCWGLRELRLGAVHQALNMTISMLRFRSLYIRTT